MAMKILSIEASKTSPSVHLDPESGRLEFRGRSLPADAVGFYDPILRWMREYAETHPEVVEAFIRMEYFNTASAGCLLDLLKVLEKMHKDGCDVRVRWSYEEDDEEMAEMGEDFESILDLPFHFVTTED